MYSFNLVENEDYVRLIEEVRDECTNRPVPAFPKGTGFLYWEQYLGLQETLLKNIIYALVSVFCVTFIMLIVVPKVDREKCWTLLAAAFGGAFTLVFILTLYMIEIYGFMGWMDIKLSALPAVSLIMAVGVGVEFTAHIILAFILAEGDRNDRMEAAMDHMFVPTIDGTISTFLGIVMLAFSDFEFIVKYYFLVYLIIVVLGCLNGLILLPALLAVCGPPSISLPPAGGSEEGYRRGSITSPKTSTNPALEMSAKPGSDFV
jgi:patched 1 protein